MPHSPFAFVDEPLDRADALRDDADALARLWPHARVLLIDANGEALSDRQRGLLTLPGAALGTAPAEGAVFLGMRGEHAWFAMPAPAGDALPDALPSDASRIDLRSAAALWPAFDSTLYAQARAVLHWRANARFCGACGGALRYLRAGWQAQCQSCAAMHYPRTDPAVIVAVSDGQRLLLGRQANWPAHRYSVLAGFVEPGETLEQTVAREVLEESGVRVLRSRYLASQPWPFPGSLMLGFTALAHADAPRAQEELEDVRWFERAQVLAALQDRDAQLRLSPPLSISRWLIQTWAEGIGA